MILLSKELRHTLKCLIFEMITVHLQLHLVHRQVEEDIYLVKLQSFPLRKRYLHFLKYEDNMKIVNKLSTAITSKSTVS